MANGSNVLRAQNAQRDLFKPFGELLQADGSKSFLINNGTTQRFDALAKAESVDGEVIISIFRGQAFQSPISISMMERHPLGSQAFFPLQNAPWLTVVAEDVDGKPGEPMVFMMSGDQGVQYNRNIWHHPLLSLEEVSDFLVVDRAGEGNNLEEAFYDVPYSIIL